MKLSSILYLWSIETATQWRERDIQTERQTGSQTDRQRQRDRDRDRHRDRDRQTEAVRERERQRQTQTRTQRDRDRDRQTETPSISHSRSPITECERHIQLLPRSTEKAKTNTIISFSEQTISRPESGALTGCLSPFSSSLLARRR